MAELLGTVRRATRVLDYLAARNEPVPIKRLAQELELNLSTAYHLMNTLACEGYAVRDADGGYRLGSKVALLGDAYARAWPVEPALRALVAELGARTSENAYLAMANGTDVVITDIVESQQRVRVHALHRGYSSDLHARALGKAVLAFLDEAVVRRYFADHPPRRLTARTVVSIDGILSELERVRRRGSSEDVEEFCEGVCCVGAPFFAADGRPAGSLSVSMPSFRFRARRVAAREAVLQAANAATGALQSVDRRVRNG